MPAGTCRFCGCTDDWGCDGGCSWVNSAHTVCSSQSCHLAYMISADDRRTLLLLATGKHLSIRDPWGPRRVPGMLGIGSMAPYWMEQRKFGRDSLKRFNKNGLLTPPKKRSRTKAVFYKLSDLGNEVAARIRSDMARRRTRMAKKNNDPKPSKPSKPEPTSPAKPRFGADGPRGVVKK